jgi:hypothetical protein
MKKEENLYQGLEILAISGDIIEALDEKIFLYDKWRNHYFKFKLMVYLVKILSHVMAYINDSLPQK